MNGMKKIKIYKNYTYPNLLINASSRVGNFFLSTKIKLKGKENIIYGKKFFIAASHQSMFETFFLSLKWHFRHNNLLLVNILLNLSQYFCNTLHRCVTRNARYYVMHGWRRPTMVRCAWAERRLENR